MSAFSDPSATENDWLSAGMLFVSLLYGDKTVTSLNELRCKQFCKRKNAPQIKTLPPTEKAAMERVKRARLQFLTWRCADQINPPAVDVTKYGWSMQEQCLVPNHGVKEIAPQTLLKVVACGCQAASPCATVKYSCRLAKNSMYIVLQMHLMQ